MAVPRHIVIVGGGTAGWMAANLFAKRWSQDAVTITLVESTTIGTVGVGEGSTPAMKRFFRLLDVADEQWMPRCQATYKVGIRFDDWSPQGGYARYRHPFFTQPDTFVTRAFLTNCRTRRLGLDVRTQPDDFFLNAKLARQRKAPLTPRHFPFDVDYGYHFDAQLLGQYLAELGIGRGVRRIDARVLDVEQNEAGDITRLVTDQNEPIVGDFFIDCTGFASVLMGKTLGVGFTSFKDNLYNDRAVALPTSIEGDTAVETVSSALSHGWCWHIPLANRYGNGYVYASDFLTPDEAETELRKKTSTLDGAGEARHLKMRVGQLERHWQRNCLAVGLAQGFIEPLEATALLLVQETVETFMQSLDTDKTSATDIDQFNVTISTRFEQVRDYIVAHYKLNTRTDSEYWAANRNNDKLSDSLRHLLDVWYRRGDLTAEIKRQSRASHFGTLSWHCLLAGYGAFPELADGQPGTGDLFEEQNVRDFIDGCALNFEPHDDGLARANAAAG